MCLLLSYTMGGGCTAKVDSQPTRAVPLSAIIYTANIRIICMITIPERASRFSLSFVLDTLCKKWSEDMPSQPRPCST